MLAGLKSKFLSINFFDLLMVFLVSTSFISLIALVLGLFNPTVCFFLGFLFLVFVFYFFSGLFLSNKTFVLLSPNTFWIAFLLVLAFLIRQDPFPYIMGNQDQGLYVNMSSYFQREGRVEIQDFTRDLIDAPEILSIYDVNKQNNLELGIYKTSTPRNYTFQFYHLFPIWMSIFAELFGDINRYYALTFFSLVSIVAAYLLILEITKSYFWGIFGGILLALNPLHVFFSRWPVTEIPTLCFSLCGFYYLAKFFNLYQSNEKDRLILKLTLSVFCFGLLFFTRISGFMYVPAFLVILFFAPLLKDKVFGKYLILYTTSVLVFLSISIWYGLTYSQPYSLAIYEASFSRLLGQEWQQPLFILLIVTAIFFIFWIRFSWDNLQIKNWFFDYRFNLTNLIWWLISLISVVDH